MRNAGETETESQRRRAYEDYAREFAEWRAGWTDEEVEAAEFGGYDQPLPYESGRRANFAGDDDDDFHDPADRAVDNRVPIVDFESVSTNELQRYSDDFHSCLVWATRTRNGAELELMQMGARMLTMFDVLAPELKAGMNLPIPRAMREQLKRAISSDAFRLGEFFWLPLVWVRKCTSLDQLGKRGFAMISILAGDLIDSMTCAAIGALDNKTRQAANKLMQDFRDSFGGIKSLPMRGKITRKRCKQSQEKK